MQDHKKELMLIKDLMDKLVEEMEPTASDFDEALGRKPEIKSVEIQGIIPAEESDEMEDEMDMEEEMSEESPEEALKRRIMKMRE